MAQQTAVEQLVNYMMENFHLTDEALQKFEQAKQMEREQIEDAYAAGYETYVNEEYSEAVSSGENYYKETYTTRLQNETN